MDFFVVYLVRRFFYPFFDFFHHWYVHGSKKFFHHFVNVLQEFDKTLALRITLQHFFEPLYRDYTIIGRMLGIVFRSVRVAIGSVFYLAVAAVFFLLYLLWLLVPVAIVGYAIGAI